MRKWRLSITYGYCRRKRKEEKKLAFMSLSPHLLYPSSSNINISLSLMAGSESVILSRRMLRLTSLDAYFFHPIESNKGSKTAAYKTHLLVGAVGGRGGLGGGITINNLLTSYLKSLILPTPNFLFIPPLPAFQLQRSMNDESLAKQANLLLPLISTNHPLFESKTSSTYRQMSYVCTM